MATTTTTVLGLVKPTPGTGEPWNQSQNNSNLDAIDSAIGAKTVKITTTTVTNSTSETSLGSMTIPSGASQQTTYELRLWGTFDHTTGTPTLTLRAKIGGTTFATFILTMPASTLTNKPWRAQIDIVCITTGVSGTWRPVAHGFAELSTTTTPFGGAPSAATTKDTTANQTRPQSTAISG
jgi:hypothetical protein